MAARKKPRTHADVAIRWAEDVVSGKEDRCEYVKLACKRFLADLKRSKRKNGWTYWFDADEANRRCRWLETLPHVKGKWRAKRERLKLGPWQAFIVCNLFGWKSVRTGLRRFREAYSELPRKNGKSLTAAAIGLNLFAADGECGAEVYSGATTEKQAWEVFRPAKQICQLTDSMREFYDIEVNAKSLVILSEGNRFEPIIGNPGDGSSPSCAIVDEFHEHSTSDLVDTMQTGMGARDQPLLLIITTAGTDFGGPCREKREDVIRILEGTIEDETVFGIIFTIDEGDRWDTEAALKKANPNFGVSVNREFLLTELAKARRSSSKQNAFKTKHLNLWVGAKSSWMNMLAFQRCKRPKLALSQFAGRQAFLGIDLASRVDVASIAILIPKGETLNAFFRHYLPEESVYGEIRNDRYQAWAEAGHLTTTPGDVIDFDVIEDDLKELASDIEIVECGYDPFQATQFSTHMGEEGFEMVEVRPTVLNFSEPMKELEAKVLQRQFLYDGDPVFAWMMGNVVAKLDKKDNIYPDKERPDNKIDGVVAAIMAMNRWMAWKDDAMPEDYELTIA